MLNIVSPVVANKIIFVLAIVNAVTVTVLFSTCRCIPTSKIGAGLMKYRWYKSYYKYHCYIWWVFWPSVIVHAILGISVLGVPF